tara:strand:+ start:1049 stop:1810 length:762 start_codon:yes stop_codon:yes gene_type:complete
MNFFLNQIPERTKKPRENGLTMMMDKGLSINDTKNFIDTCKSYVDIVKLGFGTSAIYPNIIKKIKLYKNAGITVYLGGTLFEAFVTRGMFKQYKELLESWQLTTCEVSDGCISIPHQEKCKYISDLANNYRVLSEIGSKDENIVIESEEWVRLMQDELQAGAWKVIAEAREGGNVGVFNKKGNIRINLIDKIIKNIPNENILWEAPKKSQQVWFIDHVGSNVNLGNIAYDEVIPLECLRIGLRGDTFHNFLNS